MVSANLMLGAIGFLQNPRWVSLFLQTGQRKFSETVGLHPTLLGISEFACGQNNICAYTFFGSMILLLVGVYLYFLYVRRRNPLGPMEVLALVTPISLLLSVYGWAYEQVLLLITIVFAMQQIEKYHQFLPYLFPLLIDLFSLLLLYWAQTQGIDVWSAMLPVALVTITAWFLRPQGGEQAGV